MTVKLEEQGSVLFNDEIAPNIYWLSASMPQIASASRPGQFVQVRVASEPAVQFLRMPFCVYRADAAAGTVDICYQVVGDGTKQLARIKPDDEVNFVGPIGNGWSVPAETKHALLACGGVGAPALNLLAAELVERGVRVDTVMGATTADRLICTEGFEQAARKSDGAVHYTTDDGTAGTKGFVNAVSNELIAQGDYDYVAACGPLPMERSVIGAALERGICTQVSMEKLMACGIGACLGCVVETTQGLKRCCVDGPVFDAGEVIW